MLDRADILDPRAAAVFAVPRQRRIVLMLISQERSLNELATVTQTPLNLLHHHMRRFMQLGLVCVTRQEARAGAPIKFYRAAARQFFVPAEIMAADTMISPMRKALDRELAARLRGVVYTHDGKGPSMRRLNEPDQNPATTEILLELHLTRAEAMALAAQLRALVKRVDAPGNSGREHYIFHAALARSPA